MKMGKGYYLALGRNIQKSGEIVPLIGTAVIVQLEEGPKVRMHGTISYNYEYAFHGQMFMAEFNPKTLIGQVEGLFVDAYKTGPDGSITYSIVVYTRPCP